MSITFPGVSSGFLIVCTLNNTLSSILRGCSPQSRCVWHMPMSKESMAHFHITRSVLVVVCVSGTFTYGEARPSE